MIRAAAILLGFCLTASAQDEKTGTIVRKIPGDPVNSRRSTPILRR